jgi:hypothetical protein
VVLQEDEEARQHERQQYDEQDAGMAQNKYQLEETQHKHRYGLQDLVNKTCALSKDFDVLELKQLVVSLAFLDVFEGLLPNHSVFVRGNLEALWFCDQATEALARTLLVQ